MIGGLNLSVICNSRQTAGLGLHRLHKLNLSTFGWWLRRRVTFLHSILAFAAASAYCKHLTCRPRSRIIASGRRLGFQSKPVEQGYADLHFGTSDATSFSSSLRLFSCLPRSAHLSWLNQKKSLFFNSFSLSILNLRAIQSLYTCFFILFRPLFALCIVTTPLTCHAAWKY